jgi:hypothetical protein
MGASSSSPLPLSTLKDSYHRPRRRLFSVALGKVSKADSLPPELLKVRIASKPQTADDENDDHDEDDWSMERKGNSDRANGDRAERSRVRVRARVRFSERKRIEDWRRARKPSAHHPPDDDIAQDSGRDGDGSYNNAGVESSASSQRSAMAN